MFNFNDDTFDFNQLYEGKSMNLSLDDYTDDEDFLEPIFKDTKVVYKDQYNFDVFLTRIFNAIGKTKQIIKKDPSIAYCYKRVEFEGAYHDIAYIRIREKLQKGRISTFHLFIHLNESTKELEIGNCDSFVYPNYLTISYPLIKICEMYSEGPVYISDIFVDMPSGYIEPVEDTLKKIELPFDIRNIRLEVNLYRCTWNEKDYWYPFNANFKEDKFVDVNLNLHISHEFIEHLTEIKNTLMGAHINLYYKAFESFDDFKKLVTLICGNGGRVNTDLNVSFTEDDFIEKLAEFKDKVDEYFGSKELVITNLIEDEYKQKIELLLPESCIQAFENVNIKEPNTLSVFKLAKLTKSAKNVYRKFDLPIIELILKDNGIDVESIIKKYESEWENNFYKFANLIIDHLNHIEDMDPAFKPRFITNLLWYGKEDFSYKLNTKETEYKNFSGLTNEEKEVLKQLMFGLKDTEKFELDKSKVTLNDEYDEKALDALFKNLETYPSGLLSYSDDDITMHSYNRFIILERFVYLLGIITSKYYNEHKLAGDTLTIYAPRGSALYNMNYNTRAFDRFTTYNPYKLSDIYMPLTTYESLYRFITYIAYIIENGYDIKIPFLGYDQYSYSDIVKTEFTLNDLVEAEFDLDNTPNLELLNTSSISKMLTTIFTNIDKKI